jgi:hypothetical protein
MKALATTWQFTSSANLTVGNNTQSTTAVDMQGFEGLAVYMRTGVITAAGAGITFKLQHSDTLVGTDFVDVPADQFTGSIAAVDNDADDTVLKAGALEYLGNKRYVRAQAVGSASANGILHLMFIRHSPTSVSGPMAATFALTATT